MSQITTVSTESRLTEYSFPETTGEEWQLAEILKDVLKSIQGKRNANRGGGITRHVEDEERLEEDCAVIIRNLREGKLKVDGVQHATIEKLNTNKRYYQDSIQALRMRGSYFFPLSLLMYGQEGVEEITCLAYNRFFVSRGTERYVVLGGFPDEDTFYQFMENLLSTTGGVTGDTTFNKGEPFAEANFSSIARITVAVKPAISVRANIQASIRIHGHSKVQGLTEGYVSKGIMPLGAAQFLDSLVRGRANMLFTGPTRSGKTTLMRVCCGLIDPTDRVVVVEDNAELALDRPGANGKPYTNNVIGFTTSKSARIDQKYNVSQADLVRHALRFAPDRIIMGEARGGEMAEVCKALTTGHDGSMSTIHSDDALGALSKMSQLMQEDERYRGNSHLANEVAHDAFHIIVHLGFFNRRRVVTGIVCVDRRNDNYVYQINDAGVLELKIRTLRDLSPALQTRLGPLFPNGLLPPVTGAADYPKIK